MEKKVNRINYISILSGVSCFAVVMLHSNGAFWTFSKDRYWMSANFIECFMYFAVPIFFMISGVTLINYRDKYSTKDFFDKRIKKPVIPFIVWSIIGVIYQTCAGGMKLDFSVHGFKSIIGSIMNTNVIGVYWFFIPLLVYIFVYQYFHLFPKIQEKIYLDIV